MKQDKKTELSCLNCAYFDNDPWSLEKNFKNLRILCSGFASVRGDSGICYFDDTFRMPRKACESYKPMIRAKHQP